jgi:hypothetical protein
MSNRLEDALLRSWISQRGSTGLQSDAPNGAVGTAFHLQTAWQFADLITAFMSWPRLGSMAHHLNSHDC